MGVSPEVPFVFYVAVIFPAGSDRSDDGDDHTQAHSEAEANLFDFAHVQIPGNCPWESSHDEVHDDVVH